MEFKDKKELVFKQIFGLNLTFTSEDKEQIAKLIETYFRKRTNIANSTIENIAGGLLWVYSRINFLFQDNKLWSQQSIAGMLGIKPKTISSTASKIMNALKIDCFDERFARKNVAEQNPLNNFFMTKLGFILHKDDIKKISENSHLLNIADISNNEPLNEKPSKSIDAKNPEE